MYFPKYVVTALPPSLTPSPLPHPLPPSLPPTPSSYPLSSMRTTKPIDKSQQRKDSHAQLETGMNKMLFPLSYQAQVPSPLAAPLPKLVVHHTAHYSADKMGELLTSNSDSMGGVFMEGVKGGSGKGYSSLGIRPHLVSGYISVVFVDCSLPRIK